MSKSITAPYITLDSINLVLNAKWKNSDDGNDPFDGAYLDSFTPTNKKNLLVTFEIKPAMIWGLLKLAPDAELCLSAAVLCPSTRKIICTPNIRIGATDKDGEVSAELQIPEGSLSNFALFECKLVLANDSRPTNSLGARFKSSLLWKYTTKVLIEGSSAMFPVTAEKFTSDYGGPTAAWRMNWKKATLLSSPSKVRLIMNSDNSHFEKLLKNHNPDGFNSAYSLLQYCVACSMLENICTRFAVDFKQIKNEELREGTLGHNFNMFFKKFFYPEFATITDLIEAYADNPEQCRSILQSKIPGTLIHV